MSNIKRLKDNNGNYIYPVTHASAVFDSDGNNLLERISHTNMDRVNVDKFLKKSKTLDEALSLAFEESNNVVVNFGEYEINNTILIPSHKNVDFNGATILLNNDVNGISMEKNSSINNLNIRVNVSGFTSNCIYFDGANKHDILTKTIVNNVNIIGNTDKLGTAVMFDASTDNACILSVFMSNMSIRNFEVGIKMISSKESSYINGNIIYNIHMYDCKDGIYMIGDESAGIDNNSFKEIAIQASSYMSRCVYVSGKRNTFDCSLWDLGVVEGKTFISYEFSAYASYNSIKTRGGVTKIKNNSGYNDINNTFNSLEPIVLVNGMDKTQSNATEHTLHNYIGKQDNVLANGHKKYAISVEGKNPNSINHSFNLDPSKYSLWSGLTNEDEIKITVDLTNEPIKYCTVIGCVFAYRHIPDYVKIEVVSGNDTTYLLKEEYTFTGSHVFVDHNLPDTIKSIIFTFKKSSGGGMVISNFFAGANGTKGNHFIDTSGGNVYGDIIYETGKGAVLTSPDGTKYRLTVSNDGTLSATKI